MLDDRISHRAEDGHEDHAADHENQCMQIIDFMRNDGLRRLQIVAVGVCQCWRHGRSNYETSCPLTDHASLQRCVKFIYQRQAQRNNGGAPARARRRPSVKRRCRGKLAKSRRHWRTISEVTTMHRAASNSATSRKLSIKRDYIQY